MMSIFFDLQIGSKISTSIVSTTDDIMTADNDAVGIKAKCGVKNEQAAITINPVIIPPNGVCTPLALLTVDLPKEAVMGNDPANDPTSWHMPKANIS